MKGMASAKEYWQAPPPGRYLSKATAVEAMISKAGASMLKIDWEVKEPKEHAGATATDYIITDGSAKGGGMGKKKLRGLGINVDTDEEIPDNVLAQQLLGLEVYVEFGNEPMMTETIKGSKVYDKPVTAFDTQAGKEVAINKLTVENYFRHNVGAPTSAAQSVQTTAPIQQVVPQGAPQFAPVQGAPQGFVPGQAPGFPPQGYAPQGYPQQFAGAPAGWAPGVAPGAAPQGYAPQMQQGFQQGFPQGGQAAVPPWVAAQQQVPQGVPAQAEAEEGGGKKRGKKS